MSSFTDIDKKKWPEDSCPSCGVNWHVCFFKDDIHNHVKKCQLEKQSNYKIYPVQNKTSKNRMQALCESIMAKKR